MRSSYSSRLRVAATPVAAAVAVMLLAPGLAAAQQAAGAAPADQTITVTGIRRGIESAINNKKNADSIIESISAEDIGKLPDSSIAESIARLPGIAAQRVGGRATEINIRGLSGDFANTLLNGREQVSTGNNRSVEFDQFPSELIAGVDVYKAPSSTLVGQGLSGTLDLKTVRPLSFGQRTISINVRGERNGEGTPFKGDGNRVTATYIDQFADRTVGVVLGVARLQQNTKKTRTETYDPTNTGNFPGVNGGADFTFNQGFKYFVDENDETRTGAMGAIEFKPNKDISSMVDFFYSKFEKEFVKRGIELQVNDSWKSGNPALAFQAPTLTNAVVQNNRLISGVWGNVNPLSRTIWEPREDDLTSAGWNTRWKILPALTTVLDLSTSRAKSKERITEMEAGVYDTTNNRPLPGTVTVSNYDQVTAFQYNHGDPSIVRLTDPESWGQNGYDKTITTDDKMSALRLQAEYDMEGVLSRITGGVNVNNREKTKGATESFVRLANRTSTTNPGAVIPGATTVALPGAASPTIGFDPGTVFNSGVYRLDSNVNSDILNKGWTVKEEVTTVFARADMETELAGLPLRGNLGMQVINTDQRSTAPQIDTSPAGFTNRTDGKSYTDVLPSLNLTLEVGKDQLVRAAIARQMARPRMDQLRAFRKTEVNSSGRWEGNGGNPLLDPFRATALDVSYEKYFGNKGYVSIAGFYKDLKSYIFEVKNTNFDFTGLPNLSGRTPTQGNIGDFTAPVNGKGGKVQGIELAVSVPLGLLLPALDGFGVQLSHSDTSSKIKPFGDADTRPLPGLSKQVSQFTAYYEKFGFSARVATRKRSAFLGETQQFGADQGTVFIRGEQLTDVQLGYEFQSGIAKGLSLLVQVNNAGNEPYREFNDSTGRDTKLDENGRTILFGVSYKF
jgi:iron complex outermembrane recepter protein